MSCVNMNIAEKKLNANQLKIIAIIAMLIDHVALSFLPSQTVLYQIMRAIGKITMPIMCYFIAEGYYKTSNIKKYLLRLILFSLFILSNSIAVSTVHRFPSSCPLRKLNFELLSISKDIIGKSFK